MTELLFDQIVSERGKEIHQETRRRITAALKEKWRTTSKIAQVAGTNNVRASEHLHALRKEGIAEFEIERSGSNKQRYLWRLRQQPAPAPSS